MPEMEHSDLGDFSDQELMHLVQEGDEKAFETLMFRHEDQVFRLAMRILGRREEARDTVQEVFIKLWENPHSWKPKALFTTWLYRVVMNHSLWRMRKLKLKTLFSLSEMEMEVSEFGLTDEADSPEEQLVKKEEAGRLEAELKKLPVRQRTALHLRYREELSVQEVAETIGVSVRSAESLIYRGKISLRERLDND